MMFILFCQFGVLMCTASSFVISSPDGLVKFDAALMLLIGSLV